MATRGVRNNNPLNIVRSKSDWEGKVPFSESTDKTFEQFTSMPYGWRATCKQVSKYINAYNINTVSGIINRWATGENKNKIDSYINTVTKRTGFQKAQVITSDAELFTLVAAMSYVESQINTSGPQIRQSLASAGLETKYINSNSYNKILKSTNPEVSNASTNSINTNASQNATPNPENIKGSVAESDEALGKGKGLDPNGFRNKGTVYPFIRINDHYFTADEIVEFYIESGYYKDFHEYKNIKIPRTGFVPTIHIILKTSSSDLLKQNQIKSGDKIAVFISNGGGMVKSYRADYVINSAVTTNKPSEIVNQPVTYIIDGELFIPNLHSELEKTVLPGSSRDVLMQIAEMLGLGFYFCDPDNTDDYQGWASSTSLEDFALEVASRSWKNFESFFDCWIDPRYGLSFININKMLGEDGLDESMDITPFVKTILNNIGIDGRKAMKTEEELKKDTRPQGKILTNIAKEDESATPFYVKDWRIVNRAGEIANEIGVNSQQSYCIDNPGVETQNTNIDMNYSIPINMKKLQNGFFVLIGPGVNLTYEQADQISASQSFVKNSFKVMGGNISEVMSDGDAQNYQMSGGNSMASGNVNKFYDAAWEHNMRNNLQLQKQYTEVECQGVNLGIMRGEKIPMLIIDNDKLFAMKNVMTEDKNDGTFNMANVIYEMASGWYIIDGIMWKWEHNDALQGSTYWKTKLKLVRREWPIAGRSAISMVDTENQVAANTNIDTATGRSSNGTNQSGSGADNGTPAPSTQTTTEKELGVPAYSPEIKPIEGSVATESVADDADQPSGTDMPTTGLSDAALNVYNTLKSEIPEARLVSARRWAVDENGKRVSGNAFVTKNGLYKCCNAKGEIMYFKSNNSKHLYGEAIDIVNGPGQSFDGMLEQIMTSNAIVRTMCENGMAMCKETSSDDSGVTASHYHIGTDPDIQTPFWNAVLNSYPMMPSDLKALIQKHQSFNKQNSTVEVKHEAVQENA